MDDDVDGAIDDRKSGWAFDRVLLVATRTGDQRAIDSLCERHYDGVLAYLARETGDPDLAADLTQETFLRALPKLGTLRHGEAFVVWLLTIAHHVLTNHRKRVAAKRPRSLEALCATFVPGDPSLRVPDGSRSCEDRDGLDRAMVGLSPRLRTALLLHCHEGFTAPEIARITGVSAGAAERQLTRAKAAFRERYRAAEEGERR
ncbi:MAG: RNA polymerase sigma factor [Thermomicrobiales bacterium]